MISHINHRAKKSSSFALQRDNKENKENCNLNVQQLPALQVPAKLNKIRSSLGPVAPGVQALKKNFSTLHVVSQVQIDQLHLSLKKHYSQQTKKDYSQDILNHLISKNSNLGPILKNHLITSHLRAKMVDWMIEVLSSYKMSEDCFFRSVRYMDLLFKNSSKKLQVADLHLIGVVAMFTSSKYQQIYPLKLNVIYDKICRKKFPKEDILRMEEQLISSMSFQLQQVTCYDILCHILNLLEINLGKKEEEYLKKVCVYLSKMSMHCSELAWVQNSVLGAANLFIALKTVQQVQSSLKADDYLQIIANHAKIEVSELLECSQQLLSLAKNFSKSFPNLSNLKRFNNAEYCQ